MKKGNFKRIALRSLAVLLAFFTVIFNLQVLITGVSAEDGNNTNPTGPRYEIVGGIYTGGVLIQDHQTQATFWSYCADEHHVWPSVGMGSNTAYTGNNLTGDNSDLSGEKAEQLARVMYAGYPNDALGLSALAQTKNSAVLAAQTQMAVWCVRANDGKNRVDQLGYSYVSALYEYAKDGTLSGAYAPYLNNAVTASVTASVTNLSLTNLNDASADLILTSNKDVMTSITSIPEGTSLYDGTTRLNIGDIVNIPNGTKTLTLVRTDATQSITRPVSFQYVTDVTSQTADDLLVYMPEPAANESGLPYQRMIGFAYPTQTNTLSVTVSTAADSGNEEQTDPDEEVPGDEEEPAEEETTKPEDQNENDSQDTTKQENNKTVQTSASTHFMPWILLMIDSVLAASILQIQKRRA